jgi:hypothetical protein
LYLPHLDNEVIIQEPIQRFVVADVMHLHDDPAGRVLGKEVVADVDAAHRRVEGIFLEDLFRLELDREDIPGKGAVDMREAKGSLEGSSLAKRDDGAYGAKRSTERGMEARDLASTTVAQRITHASGQGASLTQGIKIFSEPPWDRERTSPFDASSVRLYVLRKSVVNAMARPPRTGLPF